MFVVGAAAVGAVSMLAFEPVNSVMRRVWPLFLLLLAYSNYSRKSGCLTYSTTDGM
jgi:hypothetical protein